MMKRRNFLKIAGLGSAFSALPMGFKLQAAPADYTGKLVVTLQAEGGWDVSSICDPKMNVPNEEQINHWAINGETQEAGSIRYAPFANNAAFFDKYYNDMLVINGIDSQTNSHSAGVTHNWSGRISTGYPTLTALFAAANAPYLPISYINNGGYAETAGLTRYTRLDSDFEIRNIVNYNSANWNENDKWVPEADWQIMQDYRNARYNRQAGRNLSLRELRAMTGYRNAIDNSAVLSDFATQLSAAGELAPDLEGQNFWSSLKRQMQLALLSMKSGTSVAADLYVGGYDTHSNHDTLHAALLSHTTDSIDYFWEYAEQLGIADRIILVINSDFSRTPYYNATNGKDHWPVGSAIIMEKDAAWGNRMVGLTDGAQNIIKINPSTLQPDEANGKVIYPKHVMQSLREYVGIDNHAITQPFAFNNSESFDFFSTDKSTPQESDVRNLIRE